MKINKIKDFIKNKNIHKQFIKYLLVGGSTAVFELSLFTLFRKVIFLNIISSNITATILATLLNFIINRRWSFKSDSNIIRSLIAYIILFSFNTIFSTAAISFMVKSNIPDVFAKLITICMVTMWNFILYRKLVFIKLRAKA